jgi:hypothetical protein
MTAIGVGWNSFRDPETKNTPALSPHLTAVAHSPRRAAHFVRSNEARANFAELTVARSWGYRKAPAHPCFA